MNTQSALDVLFHPHTIAVIGVSHDETSVGSTIYKNIVEGNFPGSVFPVNPFLKTFQGVTAFPSVLSVPQPIDCSIIVVPAAIVPSVLEEVGKKGCPVAIIISSGFREIGSKGMELEKKIQDIAHTYSVALLGPNCLGIISPNDSLNASFARTKPIPGSIAFLSQSGALGTALLDIITPKGIGISYFISLGNKADINELDMLEYVMADSRTSVIGMYVEQLTEASRVIDIGRKMARMDKPKPIIVLKGGKTMEGSTAVHSHTGALAGIPESYSALFRQSMMIEATSTQDFINALVAFSQNPLPTGNSCAILTNAGGPAILATDTLITAGVSVPALAKNHNPIDLLGDAKAVDFQKTLAILEQDTTVHSILGIVTPQTTTEIDDTANAFCMHKSTSIKPLSVCWMGDSVMKSGKQLLDMGKIPNSKYPEQTAIMLSHLHTFTSLRTKIFLKEYERFSPILSDQSPINVQDPLTTLMEYKIPVPPYVFVQDSATLSSALSSLAKTLVIKIISPDIIHKSDVGAIQLNVPKEHVCVIAEEMISRIQKTHPLFSITGILAMDMVDTHEGQECIVGLKKIPDLGTVIMVGMGGIFVEIMKDVTFRFAPLTRGDAMDLIEELQSSQIFNGVRGKPALDKEALIKILLSVSRLAEEHPDIQELDINPLVVFPQGEGVIALDARVKTQ